MINSGALPSRELKKQEIKTDFCIVGGGMSGVCAAVTAARQGVKVVLVQDRPVLGGNASSEVRLWILGATSHMGNNNRWSREGGVINEILVENVYRNPEGNPVILDMILLDKVHQEPNITLLLNTAVYEVIKANEDQIDRIKAFCSQNSTTYVVAAPLFCDASGDGIAGFLAGAAFRMGAECREEFDELMAPDAEYGELLGHSLYFYTKDTGKPVQYSAPSFALDVQASVPRYQNFDVDAHGCKLWWVEYGGRLDTVHDTEQIKWELWKVVYGIWDYIKNSGKFPEAETYTLEWVGTIPGKRESRRFEGLYMLSQTDIIEQKQHHDAVAYGGWSIDLHPADGVFSDRPPCNQWHSKGIFQIPYRCLYSKNISNLFLAGRIISVSHVAFGATRVMATSAYSAQASAIAAAICLQHQKLPAQIYSEGYVRVLQKQLMKTGQYIPGLVLNDEEDLVQSCNLTASSTLYFKGFDRSDVLFKPLNVSAAQLFPFGAGQLPVFNMLLSASEKTVVQVQLRCSERPGGYTPDCVLMTENIQLNEGEQEIDVEFDMALDTEKYIFICFMQNEKVQLACSRQRITGLLSVFNGKNKAVSNNGKQEAADGLGVDSFEFWCPQRRPEGHNLALSLSNEMNVFSVENIRNGVDRPTVRSNAWVASPDEISPSIILSWQETKLIRQINIVFDTDWDHAMESVLMTQPETVMPFCIGDYTIEDERGTIVYRQKNNYQTCNEIRFEQPLHTSLLKIILQRPSAQVPASIFSIRCYS